MKLSKLSSWKRFGLWLPLGLIIGVAIIIRWRANFDGALMSGVNGPYYPVQVRSLLENGKLGFPDFPFIFYLEAAVAKLLFFLGVANLGDCIMLASKAVDAVFPTLVAIPAFLLARSWLSGEKRRHWVPSVTAAFSVLSSSALTMVADFQKNAAGFVWFFFFAYFLYRALSRGTWKTYAAAGIAFALTGLTHIGCFGLAIVFLFVSAAISLVSLPAGRQVGRVKRRSIFLGSVILVLFLAVTVGGLYIFFDPTRVERLIGIFLSPLRVFNPPVIFDIIRGQSTLGGPHLFDWAVINMFGVFGLILLVRRWAVTEVAQRSVVIAAILSVFLLGSPFLNEHWADRLWLMAYGPAVVVVAFLLTKLYNRLALGTVTAFVLLLTILSAGMMSGFDRPASITEAAYDELYQVRSAISQPEKTLVVARHGLEWWAAWVLETDAGQEFGLDQESWEKYDQVLYLKQIAGAEGFGPGGPGAPPFPEVHIPEDAEIIFEGEYFKLARATGPPERDEHWGPPDM